MSTNLGDAILDRISFLQEQLGAEDDPAYIRTFQAQIKILKNAQIDRRDELITIKLKDLRTSKEVAKSDRTFAEIEALEWMKRQDEKLGR